MRPPAPLERVSYLNDRIWIGTREFYRRGEGQPEERLYELVLESSTPEYKHLATGRSAEGEDPGAWLENQFEKGNSEVGLPSAAGAPIRQSRFFEPYDKWKADGLAFAGDGWIWKEGQSEFTVTKTAILESAEAIFQNENLELGEPAMIGGTLHIPLVRNTHRLSIISYRNGKTLPATSDAEVDFTVDDGWIDAESVRYAGNGWILLNRSADPDHYDWLLWEVRPNSTPRLLVRRPLLASFIGKGGEQAFGRDLDPTMGSTRVLSDARLLVWYDFDSVWLVTKAGANVVFHPAANRLKITSVGANLAAFWIQNARKFYIVDFSESMGG